jgi:hypothetical protein
MTEPELMPAAVLKHGTPVNFRAFTITQYVKMGNNFSIEALTPDRKKMIINLIGSELGVHNGSGKSEWHVHSDESGDGYRMMMIRRAGAGTGLGLYLDLKAGLIHEVVYSR